ncbi:MAG: hypothetical protein HYW09_01240, partial [Candidatus Niyogibacteria bacterium]|nr:hypothetical protein [Candidatus Niyogibacteria bacterium]
MRFSPLTNLTAEKINKRVIYAALLLALAVVILLPLGQAAAQETAAVGSKPLIQAVNEADCGGALNVLG